MSLTLLVLLVPLIPVLAGILLILWWLVPRLESQYVFRPGHEVYTTPAEVGIAFDQYFIETPDGCRLSAWHLCPARPVGGIVYFHGNSGNLGIMVEILDQLYRCDLQVLAVDYRGYGWSTGIPSEAGLYQDSLSTVRYFQEHLRNEGVPSVYWGRSLGSCMAAFASAQVPPDGLILETAFRSKSTLLRYYPQFRLFQPFSRCRFETVRYLKGHLFPVLLLHGNRDRRVPFEEGRRLFDKLTAPKDFYCVEGADHVNLHRVDGVSYMRRVLQFVNQTKTSMVQ